MRKLLAFSVTTALLVGSYACGGDDDIGNDLPDDTRDASSDAGRPADDAGGASSSSGDAGSSGGDAGNTSSSSGDAQVDTPFTLSFAAASVSEGATLGTEVGRVVVDDPVQNASHTFAITGGNEGGAFEVRSDGSLRVAAALDVATTPAYSLQITVTDSNSPSRTGTIDAAITVVPSTGEPVLSGGPFRLPVPLVDGAIVGTITATDPDGDAVGSFAITQGDPEGAFAIDAVTGVITIAQAASVVAEQRTLTITARDDEAPPKTGSLNVVVDLNPPSAVDDAIDAVQGQQSTFELLTNDVGFPRGAVVSFGGGDAGGTVETHPADGAAVVTPFGSVAIDASGRLTLTVTQEGPLNFSYRLRNGGGFSDATVRIDTCKRLSVGEVFSLRGVGGSVACLRGGAQDELYTLIPSNMHATAAATLTIEASGITGGAGGVLGGADTFATDTLTASRSTAHADTLAALQAPVPGAPLNPPARVPVGVPAVGSTMRLNGNLTQSCSQGEALQGTVLEVSDHTIVVWDNANPAAGTLQNGDDARTKIASSYREALDQLFPKLTSVYGQPSDLDGNGRVVVLVTAAINRLTPPATSAVRTAQHHTRDQLTQARCPTSNVGEVIYALAPDPTGMINSNVRTASFVQGNLNPLVSELTHLLIDSRRLALPIPSFHPAWLDAALGASGAEWAFYERSVGLAPGANIVLGNLTTGPNAPQRVAAFNTYANPSFGWMRTWLQYPHQHGFFGQATAIQAQRGTAATFLRYAADRLPGGSVSLFTTLSSSPLTGMAALDAALGDDATLWLRDFAIGLYADDFPLGLGIDARYKLGSWNHRSLYTGLNGSYQLAVQPLGAAATTTTLAAAGGSRYLEFGVPAEATGKLTLTTTPDPDLWVSVVRRQ